MHKFTKQMKTHFLPLIILISLELATDPWGVHVDRVEIKDVRLPQQMQVVKETKDHHRLDGLGRTNDLPFYASFFKNRNVLQRSMAAEAEATRDARAKVEKTMNPKISKLNNPW